MASEATLTVNLLHLFIAFRRRSSHRYSEREEHASGGVERYCEIVHLPPMLQDLHRTGLADTLVAQVLHVCLVNSATPPSRRIWLLLASKEARLIGLLL